MKKYGQLLGLMLLAWWPMMVVHEAGHVIGCVFTGANIEKVVLWPWTISETVRSHSNAPLLDTWFGPTVGAFAPLAIFAWAKRTKAALLSGFFAGFCLIANGLYLGLGWILKAGDASDLIRLGSPTWTLIAFGVISFSAGLAVWSRVLFLPTTNAAE